MSVVAPFEKALAYAASVAPLSWFAGKVSDVRFPKPVVTAMVKSWSSVFHIPAAELDRAPDGYACLNEFFTRGLAVGRELPAWQPGSVVSPADGVLQQVGHLSGSDVFTVKGQEIDVAGLTGDDLARERFRGGSYALIYLSPRHYHRVHAPAEAELQGFRYLPGRLFPVNRLGMRVPHLFLRNERVVLFYETPRGSLWLVLVGASIVGRMTLAGDDFSTADHFRKQPIEHDYDPVRHVSALDEVGAFNLGSSVVLLAEEQGALASWEPGTEVRVGDVLWRARA
jgi:phosphatidylserine decarboxylase